MVGEKVDRNGFSEKRGMGWIIVIKKGKCNKFWYFLVFIGSF